ncbi:MULTISPECIES: sugar ABC transporter ATP-binding protein [unclassified Microbacterium]|uniref:sugar ABC transporter ATP-binding protein n=1 Tax=unclassified Microbacterium TaxID=2609290 RepID=UPI00214C8F19|nr:MULTISPECIES: sugar ABC transporter ATP-binding protein [unclassified Microbacterium]MCR2783818.1 sugar ABC transporter ATP-binding protein [Microbacterium sp. zg.B96]WIM15332.1 sugar ABC transporter ATP-binding protein [Microbacterium sp. zg-B96]
MTDTALAGAPVPAGPGDVVLRAHGIGKSFFGVSVLQDVGIEVRRGEVHGLVGENGAGKSTLMKILAGVYQADAGTVEYEGHPVSFTHPRQAMDAGLVTVFQEFTLLPERTVAQNVFLGREPRRGGFVDRRAMVRRTRDLLSDLGVTFIDPAGRVGSLTVAEQQIVEIVKALSFDARVISMDEPTAALSDHEVELLYAIIRKLTSRGVAVIYVSHRLKEIFDLCGRITILKDGALVSTDATADLTTGELVRRMVGRPIQAYFPGPVAGTERGAARVELAGCGNDFVDAVTLAVHAGEIVGVAGLQGSGRTELVEGIFGVHGFSRGTMRLDGRPVKLSTARAAVKAGLALVTEDRKAQGLALSQSALDNTLLVVRSVFAGRTRAARREVPGILGSLEITAGRLDQEVRFLSGGNQQKVVLAKWLVTAPQVVLFDEPTRGIDVGAKIAVYQLMRQLAAEGKAVLMVSSELPEVIGMSDRILVMRDGELIAELPAGSAEHEVLAAATGSDDLDQAPDAEGRQP